VGSLLRTVVFTVLVPGTVAMFIPWWILPKDARWHTDVFGIVALILAGAGLGIYFWCAFWAFASYGQGTPLPLDPPKRLVTHGLYQMVRNPMYVGVGTLVASEAMAFHSANLAIYLLIGSVFVYLFVLLYEEPTLRNKFGAGYEEYCRGVPRWIPRLSARDRDR
jgi:protein-S-isoprenylcysteine O-methyltransferase Ste14